MIRIKRSKSRRQLILTLSLPRLKRLRKIRKKLPSYFAKKKRLIDRSLTTFLLVASFIGISYSLAPLFFQPQTTAITQSPPVIKEAPIVKPIGLTRSIPTRLDIPDIGLSTDLILTGKNSDGTLAVPDRHDVAAWYQYSPTPGEVGPAVVVGHVDTYLGPSVFFSLRYLQPGQLIHITRQDGSLAKFKVDSLALFDQNNFPTSEVYGNINYPGLRLITCGGVFNHLTGNYMQNTVVFASYVPS